MKWRHKEKETFYSLLRNRHTTRTNLSFSVSLPRNFRIIYSSLQKESMFWGNSWNLSIWQLKITTLELNKHGLMILLYKTKPRTGSWFPPSRNKNSLRSCTKTFPHCKSYSQHLFGDVNNQWEWNDWKSLRWKEVILKYFFRLFWGI